MHKLSRIALIAGTLTVFAASAHAAYIGGSNFDMTLVYNDTPVIQATAEDLPLDGSMAPIVQESGWQAWASVSTVTEGGVDEVTITITRGNNSPMDPTASVSILIDDLYETGHHAGDPGIELSLASLGIEFTETLPQTFPGPVVTPAWTADWQPSTGLAVTVDPIMPSSHGITGNEVMGLQLTFGVVPEPTSVVLLTAGAMCLLRRRRKR